jgi:hypothetical protein
VHVHVHAHVPCLRTQSVSKVPCQSSTACPGVVTPPGVSPLGRPGRVLEGVAAVAAVAAAAAAAGAAAGAAAAAAAAAAATAAAAAAAAAGKGTNAPVVVGWAGGGGEPGESVLPRPIAPSGERKEATGPLAAPPPPPSAPPESSGLTEEVRPPMRSAAGLSA